MNRFTIFFLITFQHVLSSTINDDLVITLPDGKIQGAAYKSPNNVTYYAWRGIPFAAPPVGSLRFETPQPPQPWKGVLDATNDSKPCIAPYYQVPPEDGSEDCLYINVYTRTLQPITKLPVMFWIYGGGFVAGSSLKTLYGPDFLVEEEVVFVSFNYRLGPFGFLSTEDSAIRGNAALKDQTMALKWTHDNIALFGGDPDKITLFGESAGGVAAGLHLVSKKSAGLFRAAIVESGSALVSFAIGQSARSYAFSLADAIPGGNYGNDTQKLKEFLLEKTPEEIMNATKLATGLVLPVLEVEDEEAFITESPYELLSSGRFNQVPIIIGVCAEESLNSFWDLETIQTYAATYDYDSTLLIPLDLFPNSTDEAAVITEIKNIYLKESESWLSNLVQYAEYYSDNLFNRGVIKQGELTSNYAPVYFYQFSYYGRTWFPAFLDGAEKATHGAELPFLFNQIMFQDTDPANVMTQRRIVKLWANFAKFLNPTPEKSELLNNVTWSTISPTNLTYLNINGTLDLRYNFKENSYPKWNEIFETYGRKPFITF